MGKDSKDEKFAGYAPEVNAAASRPVAVKHRVAEDDDLVDKEIAKAMPWLTSKEIDEMRGQHERIQQKMEKSSAVRSSSTRKYAARPGIQEDDDHAGSSPNTGDTRIPSAGKAGVDTKVSDTSKQEAKKTIGKATSRIPTYSIRRQQDDHNIPPADENRDVQPQATVPLGQRNQSSSANGVFVGAQAIEGPGGSSVDRLERGESAGIRAQQSLISAELVTESSAMDPDDLRAMLRSELQAELRSNIVHAEVLAPELPFQDDPAVSQLQNVEEATPAPTNKMKKRYCIIGALLALIIGAGAAAGGILATAGRNDELDSASANTSVGSSGSQNATPAPTPSPGVRPPQLPEPTAPPAFEAPFSPTALQPSFGPQFAPTGPPSAGNEVSTTQPPSFASNPPTRSPTNQPTTLPSVIAPTHSPTNWPTEDDAGTPPTDAPTRSPSSQPTHHQATRSPTRNPTWSPTHGDPPTDHPTHGTTDAPTDEPTPWETDLLPTDHPTDTADPPPTPKPTNDPTREPEEEEEEHGCTREYKPVCGSDGTTYNNQCLAEEAGVEVESDGPC